MLLRYCLSDSEKFPVAPTITGSSRPYYYRFQSPLLLPVPVAPTITGSSRPYYYRFQ